MSKIPPPEKDQHSQEERYQGQDYCKADVPFTHVNGTSALFSEYLERSSKYKGYHYSVLTQEMISYLHEKTLEITKEVLEIFKQHNIRYMICGGTLLGAATTHKFIPWDDDIDICVLDDDYEKMKQCLLANLPQWLEVQCEETEPRYYHGWIKIRDKGSKVYPFEPRYKCNGVWIDLYKLSLVNRKDIPYIICREHLNYLIKRLSTGCLSKADFIKRVNDNHLLDKIVSTKEDSITSTDQQKAYIIMSASKIVVDYKSCFPSQQYQFEGLLLDSFNDADSYLMHHYGSNYKVLPPEELRRVGINRIDF